MTDASGPAANQPETLGNQAMSGGRWGAIRSVFLQVASVAITGVLARILSEEDFGLVAISVVVVTMFDLITRVGFGAVIIRKPDLTESAIMSTFWVAIGMGLFAGSLAVALSGPAASLAGSREAAGLVAVAALTLPLNLATRVPSGLMLRDLRFRTSAMIDMSGTLAHGILAITLAIAGLGAWAVVIGQVVRSLVILVGTVVVTRFVPKFTFDKAVVMEDIGFNLKWLGVDLTTYVNRNADYWFVGNRLGTGPLGIYYVAYVIPTLLRKRVSNIGHDVLYPIISRIQDDKERIASAYLRVVRLVAFLVLPAMAGLFVLADVAIAIGFGSGWEEAVGPLRVIAAASAVTAVGVVANPIFPAMGHPGVVLGAALLSLATLAVGLAVSWDGATLVTVAIVVLIATTLEALALQRQVKRFTGVGYGGQAAAVLPFAVASLVMAGAVWALGEALSGVGPVLQAIALIPLGGVIYLAVGRAMFWSSFREQLAASKRFVRP